jgi:twinkle protein
MVLVCHRATCGWQDGARVHDAPTAPRQEPPRPIAKPAPEAKPHKPDWLYAWFSDRCIGARTVDQFGCYAAVKRWFPRGESDAVVFPYFHGGELVNRKYRAVPVKDHGQDKDALPTLFNIDRLGEDPAEIVFAEGEADVMALFECGIPHGVSLKDGAPAKVSAQPSPEDKRFAALGTHADLLTKARRIVLAGDADEPGMALREELARRLGRHRCHTVTWPEGCKDACDVLKTHGPDVLAKCVADAEPIPIAGLQRPTGELLLALRRRPPPPVMTTGTMATDRIMKLPSDGRLIVVTGYPNGGKTTWTKFVMVHTAKDCDRRWAVFSPEMQPWEQFASSCAEVYTGKPFYPVPGVPSMSDREISEAGDWLARRVTMLVCDAEDEVPSLDWVLDHGRMAVLRDGVTDLLIDPWNELDHSRARDTTETDHIGRGLQRVKAFAARHGCNVWIIAHPAKPPPLKPGENHGVPTGYSINGSAHWFNKPDVGITIHSGKPGTAEVHLWKSRFLRFGLRGASAILDLDTLCGVYSSPVQMPGDEIDHSRWKR